MLEKLDKVPRRYRPLVSLASIPLIAKALTIGLDPPARLVPLLIGAGASVTGALVARRFLKSGNKSASLDVRGFEVEIGGSSEERAQGARQIEEVLKQRAKAGRLRYVVLSSLQGGFTRTIIGIGGDPRDVSVEAEVVKTLVAMNVKSIRVRDLDLGLLEVVGKAINAVIPSVRSEPVFVSPTQGRMAEEAGNMGVYVGTTYEGAYPRPAYLSPMDIEGHVAIFGSTGSGKTTTLTILASRVRGSGYNVIALDWAGEVSRIAASLGLNSIFEEIDPVKGGGLNPFSDKGLVSKPELLVDVLSDALDLTQPQAYLVMKVVETDGMPSDFRALVKEIESYPEEARWDKDVKRGLLRKIGILTGEGVAQAFDGSIDLESLEDGGKLIALDRVYSPTARRAYSLILLSALFANTERGRPLMIAIDEAHNLMGSQSDLMSKVMAEARKYRLYVMLATQSPSSIPNGVLLNSNTKIVHALRSSRDKEIVSQTMNLSYETLNELDKLRPGEALLQSPSIPRPILVKVELSSPPQHSLSDLVKGEPVYADAHVPGLNLLKELRQRTVHVSS
ncbi:MAG: ATP-binding protein [Acidilobus sp.]